MSKYHEVPQDTNFSILLSLPPFKIQHSLQNPGSKHCQPIFNNPWSCIKLISYGNEAKKCL